MTILERVSTVCGLLDMDGIAIHAMNSDVSSEHVRTSDEAAGFVNTVRSRRLFRNLHPLTSSPQVSLCFSTHSSAVNDNKS